MDCGQQDTRRCRNAAVEAELADRDIVGEGFSVGRADCRQQAECDRQVVMRSLFRQVGGRQVHGDPLRGKREADRGECCTHPLAALRDGLVGQADDDESRQARGELHLNLDRTGFEAKIRDSGDGRSHQAPSPERPTMFRLPPSSAGRS